MGTSTENAARRQLKVSKTADQIDAWTTQIDDLVAGYIAAGAHGHDPYRLRIDGLHERIVALKAKFEAFSDPANDPAGTGAQLIDFRAGIAEDWSALEEGLRDLTR